MMTRKENLMALYHHQSHDHIPVRDSAGVGGDFVEFENGPRGGAGGPDGFGMEWARNSAGSFGGTPAPGKVVLPDVTEWKKYVKFPDVTKYDWQAQAEAQNVRGIDRDAMVVEYGCWNGPFLRLVDLMTMTEGLMALVEEPEACAELLNAIVDYRITTLEYIKKYFDPDTVTIYDDFAHERGLFVSPDTYNELIFPAHKRWSDAVRSYGMIPLMHVCGKPEQVVPGFADEGFEAWTIAAPENDLVSLAGVCGDRLAFMGCWDLQGKWITPGQSPTEEELRQKVRDTMDTYGPCGNVGVSPFIINPSLDGLWAMQILGDEAVRYGTDFYCR